MHKEKLTNEAQEQYIPITKATLLWYLTWTSLSSYTKLNLNDSGWVKLSPVPELSSLRAPFRGWTRAGEKRIQDNLRAHAQNEPIKNY